MPIGAALGGLALILALMAFAQKLGGWEHKPAARGLGVVSGSLLIAWAFLVLPIWCAWPVAILVWSTCLWFIFLWTKLGGRREPLAGQETEEATMQPINAENIRLNDEILQLRSDLARCTGELAILRDKQTALEIHPDKKTFTALKELLPNEGCVAGLRRLPGSSQVAGSGGSQLPWDGYMTGRLFLFQERDAGAEHAFLDDGLEALRRQLHGAIDLLLQCVHQHSDVAPNPTDREGAKFRYFRKDHSEDVSTYDARRNEVFQAAKKVCELYDELVRTARKKFEP